MDSSNSYFQIRDADHTAWFTSPDFRNIADITAVITEALNSAAPDDSIDHVLKCSGRSFQPVSENEYLASVQDFYHKPRRGLLVQLDLKDDLIHCSNWVLPERKVCTVSSMLSRLMGIYQLSLTQQVPYRLDLDAFATGLWNHCSVEFLTPQDVDQSDISFLPEASSLRKLEKELQGEDGTFREWLRVANELHDSTEQPLSEVINDLCVSFREVSAAYGLSTAQQLYNTQVIILPSELLSAARYLDMGGQFEDLPGLAKAGLFMDDIGPEALSRAVEYMNAGGTADKVFETADEQMTEQTDGPMLLQ